MLVGRDCDQDRQTVFEGARAAVARVDNPGDPSGNRIVLTRKSMSRRGWSSLNW